MGIKTIKYHDRYRVGDNIIYGYNSRGLTCFFFLSINHIHIIRIVIIRYSRIDCATIVERFVWFFLIFFKRLCDAALYIYDAWRGDSPKLVPVIFRSALYVRALVPQWNCQGWNTLRMANSAGVDGSNTKEKQNPVKIRFIMTVSIGIIVTAYKSRVGKFQTVSIYICILYTWQCGCVR